MNVEHVRKTAGLYAPFCCNSIQTIILQDEAEMWTWVGSIHGLNLNDTATGWIQRLREMTT